MIEQEPAAEYIWLKVVQRTSPILSHGLLLPGKDFYFSPQLGVSLQPPRASSPTRPWLSRSQTILSVFLAAAIAWTELALSFCVPRSSVQVMWPKWNKLALNFFFSLKISHSHPCCAMSKLKSKQRSPNSPDCINHSNDVLAFFRLCCCASKLTPPGSRE